MALENKSKTYEIEQVEERVVLVGVSERDGDDAEDSLVELAELVKTAGATVVGTLIQRRESIHPGMYVGTGKVQEIAELVEYRMVDNEIMDDDGGRTSLFDQLSNGHLVEENLLTSARVEEILSAVESAFLSLQQRQMPIISDMMTIRLASTIVETGVDTSSYSFISKEVLSQYSKDQLPSQRTIAEKYGKNEASISRTVKEFIKKLEILLEQKG